MSHFSLYFPRRAGRRYAPRMYYKLFAAALLLALPARAQSTDDPDVQLVVLGIGQDGGTPQTGSHDDPAWNDETLRRRATSLGLIDRRTGKRWMFEATPDFREQWYDLDRIAVEGARAGAEPARGPGGRTAPDGVFLTHAHIGHYAGLMFLGHEVLGADRVAVYVMEEMADYLTYNGPWDQMVRYNNISLREMVPSVPVQLAPDIRVIPFLVPHRQEYAEVVGYRIEGPSRTALFIPDIDSWTEWDAEGHRLEGVLETVDIAFVDGTFFQDGEVPGRDMSAFPHPRIQGTMDRLAPLPAAQRAKVHFIHLNNTNAARIPDSPEANRVREAGFNIARLLQIESL